MRDIFIYCDTLLKNYITDPDYYSYMNCDEIIDHRIKLKLKGFHFNGKYVHTNYLYWLAKNRGYNNIFLTNKIEEVPSGSVLFFHHDNHYHLKYRNDLKYVQILSDKPLIPFADYYITNSKSFFESKRFNNVVYLPEPLPVKNLDFTPNISVSNPINFRFLGIRNNFPDFLDLDTCSALEKDGINIVKDFSKNFLDQSDDVFFFLRKELNPMCSCKHSNRVFLSYITEIPFIGTISDDDEFFLKDVDDVVSSTYSKNKLLECFYYIKRPEIYRELKTKLASVNKDFYKNYFYNELDKVVSYFGKL